VPRVWIAHDRRGAEPDAGARQVEGSVYMAIGGR
jgi:hypothetical protein